MTIAIAKKACPPKSGPARSSELRKALTRIEQDTDQCVLLFPDESADLARLRNRAGSAISALRKDGMNFLTRTTSAVPPNAPEGTAPVTCVGIWRIAPEKNEAGETKGNDAPKANAAAKPAAPKATAGAAAKAAPKKETA